MNSPMLGLRTTIYKVSNISEAKEWYAKAFSTDPYFDEPFYVGFEVGGYELGLQPEEVSPGKKSDNVITYWGVDDIKKEFDRLIELGAAEYESPQNVGGEIMVASVKDPWDNCLGIIYNPDFEPG